MSLGSAAQLLSHEGRGGHSWALSSISFTVTYHLTWQNCLPESRQYAAQVIALLQTWDQGPKNCLCGWHLIALGHVGKLWSVTASLFRERCLKESALGSL